MAIPGKRASTAESLATIYNVVLSTFIVLSLYFGRDLLIPLALSAANIHARFRGHKAATLARADQLNGTCHG